MASSKRFAVNIGMNWVAMAISMVVPFFLTPFIIRSLGVTAYGIWIVAVSTVSYLGILDMGLRSAVIRFVSKAEAQGKPEDARAAIGAALWFRLLISGGVALISVGLAFGFPHWFKIPADLQRAGQITVVLCALGVAVTLVSGVFGAVLAATHRFDILSSLSALQTLARAGGVIVILKTGHGLVPLAIWELTIITLSGLAAAVAALKTFPPSRVRIARPDISLVKQIWAYSFTTFVFIIAVQIIVNTDNLVVGSFISVGIVAFYSIGASLVNYAGQVVSSMSTTFTPLASNMEAGGRSADLRRLLLRGSQAALGIALPICIALAFRGRTFINLWMGPEYGAISEKIVQILLISQFFSVANGTAASIMMAIDKHKPLARWSVVEAALNLGLSLILVKTVGLYGVALGTTIAMVFVHLAFWPRYVRKILHVPIHTFIWEGWLKMTVCSIPYAIACILTDRLWHPSNMLVFFVQIAAILPIYALCVIAIFNKETRSLITKWMASRTLHTEMQETGTPL
jgi:O-antigen/teichoic acid export membrane protein